MYKEVLKKGTILPDDFFIHKEIVSIINRDKYIVEIFFPETGYTPGEYIGSIQARDICAIVMGLNGYQKIRVKERTEEDEPYDLSKSVLGKYMASFLQEQEELEKEVVIKD